MAKISFNSLKSRCASLGFKLGRTEAGVYTITKHGELETSMCGEFDTIRVWMLGYEFYKQHVEFNYVLLSKNSLQPKGDGYND